MSATFLATGFEPFGRHRTNSSWDALELLRAHWPATIATRRLPVDHRAAHELLRQTLDELRPRAVLCTGLADGRVFRIEHHARRPEALNAEVGGALLRGRWPWQEMRAQLETCGAVVDSTDAGQYVCESTYWSLLTYAARQAAAGRPSPEFAAFLHVPPVSNEYPLGVIAKAVGQVVDARYAALARTLSPLSGGGTRAT